MATILKQSTAVDVLIGPFVDLTDGSTSETGESPTVKLSKNGQALATKNDATTPVHDADGYYNCELDATDTNTVGSMVLIVAASATALPVRHEFQVIEEAVYDDLYAGSAAGYAGVSELATVDSNVDSVLVDTNELQGDWADGGRLDLILDARASQTSVDTVDTNVDSILDDTGTSGVVISTATAQAIADEILTRSVSNVEGTPVAHSLTELILANFEFSLSGTTWTIKKTDGSTTYNTRTVTTNASADPITDVT